jgi:hypothetical protein
MLVFIMMLLDEKATLNKLTDYLTATLGLKSYTTAWGSTDRLPLFLLEQYSFHIMHAGNTTSLLFIENSQPAHTPASISKHAVLLNQFWSGHVIYVCNWIDSTRRRRLIQARVPFIVPDNQLYLPFLGYELKERFPPPLKKTRGLSPSAQVLILARLYRKEWIQHSPEKMSGFIGLTSMTIGRAFKELQLHGLAEITVKGREKRLQFAGEGTSLWDRALPLLKSPVTSSQFIPLTPTKELLIAGEAALSHFTNLSQPAHLSLAASNRMDIPTGTPDMQDVLLQKWAYDPRWLSATEYADPLSLYLTFRTTGDERVKQSLDTLLRNVQW